MNRFFAAARRAAAAPPIVLATMVVAGAAAAQDGPVLLSGLPPATVAGAAREVPVNPPVQIPASAEQQAPASATGQTPAQSPGMNANPQAAPDLQPGLSLNLNVIAKQLNEARINIEPRIGASTYTLDTQRHSEPAGRAEHANRQCHSANARRRPGQSGQWRTACPQ